MSDSPSTAGWTVDTLKAHFDARFESTEKAVSKAESASERRFESINEFRGTLADQQRTLMPRVEAEGRFETLSARISALESSRSVSSGQDSGRSAGIAWIVAAVSLLGMLATLATQLFRG